VRLFKVLTRILAFVGKELVEVARRPTALLSLLLGPFLIMAIFGLGYSGYRRPLATVIVVPSDSGLPTTVDAYSQISGSGLEIVDVTRDEASADARLRRREIDVVLVAPGNIEKNFRDGRQSIIQVRVNVTDPVDQNYTVFLSRALESQVNRIVIERIAEQGQAYALRAGEQLVAQIPPSVIAAPTRTETENVAPSQPTVVQFFGAAVLALILQHMAATLIALSVVRERTSGLFELFRVSPISTAELVVGKLLAFGIFAIAIAAMTLLLLIGAFRVPMLGDPALLAGIVGLLVLASLGLGLLIAAVSDSERQAVQLSLLLLLSSVFFSGFVMGTDEFSEPVRSLTGILPVTHGIRLLGDVMLRGGVDGLGNIAALGGLAAAFILGAWALLRRSMRSA
jgi:ABC-2 type transport system permease protein